MGGRSGRLRRRGLAALLSLSALLVLEPAVVDDAQAVAATGVSTVAETRLPAATADQGLTVVNGGHVLTRGHGSIPAPLRRLGWTHIGDPDSVPGLVVDAYQGPPGVTAKAFVLTYADGRHVLLVHPLAAGESYHNSFVTISPDHRWLVSGEWGTVDRLLVFALPSTSATDPVQDLPLAGVITLAHPVRNVQGCDSSSPRQLLCSTNDTTTSLFPVARQLLAVDLDRAPQAGRVAAAVHLVGSVPAQDVCPGPDGEVEGIDVTDGTVRVAVNTPCSAVTEIFTYPRDVQWRTARDIDVEAAWGGTTGPVDAVVERRTLTPGPA